MNKEKKVQNLVIHTCCADCLLNSLQNLEHQQAIDNQTEITLLFYNPNIHPRSEYLERLNAVKKILEPLKEKYNLKLVIPNYSPKEYMKEILCNSTEVGRRCFSCWELRIKHLVKYAKRNDISNVTTTLLSSHYQDREKIREIMQRLCHEEGINPIDMDNTCNSKHSGFYKQNYCGCCFSLTEKMIQSNSNLSE